MRRSRAIVGIALLLVICVVLIVLRATNQKLPPAAATGAIRPVLTAPTEGPKTNPQLVKARTPLNLQVAIASQAFIYVFDEYENAIALLWEHEGPAWEPGEYAADAAPLEAVGLHRLIAIASPLALQGVGQWKVVTRDTVAMTCPTCEWSELTLAVQGERTSSP